MSAKYGAICVPLWVQNTSRYHWPWLEPLCSLRDRSSSLGHGILDRSRAIPTPDWRSNSARPSVLHPKRSNRRKIKHNSEQLGTTSTLQLCRGANGRNCEAGQTPLATCYAGLLIHVLRRLHEASDFRSQVRTVISQKSELAVWTCQQISIQSYDTYFYCTRRTTLSPTREPERGRPIWDISVQHKAVAVVLRARSSKSSLCLFNIWERPTDRSSSTAISSYSSLSLCIHSCLYRTRYIMPMFSVLENKKTSFASRTSTYTRRWRRYINVLGTIFHTVVKNNLTFVKKNQ